MGKLVSLAALAVSAVSTTVVAFMFYSDNWVEEEKLDGQVKTHILKEGLFRLCMYVGDSHRNCDDYDEWVFSPNFPSWILVGRILLFLSIVIGFFSTIGFLLGSDVSTMYANQVDKKKWLKRASSIAMIIAASLSLMAGIWAFIKIYRSYTDVASVIYSTQFTQASMNSKYIPSSATYTTIIVSCMWVIFSLMALFGTKNESRRD